MTYEPLFIRLRMGLSILLWVIFPMSVYYFTKEPGSTSSSASSSLLFALYVTFSWSIILLIFKIESARLKLLKQNNAIQSSLRLGVYAVISIFFAYIASPDAEYALTAQKILIITLVFLFGFFGGLAHYLVDKKI